MDKSSWPDDRTIGANKEPTSGVKLEAEGWERESCMSGGEITTTSLSLPSSVTTAQIIKVSY